MKKKRLGQTFLSACKLTLQAQQSHTSTLRKRQSTPNVGYKDCTQDGAVTFSLKESSSMQYLYSGTVNPKTEIPTITHVNSEKL